MMEQNSPCFCQWLILISFSRPPIALQLRLSPSWKDCWQGRKNCHLEHIKLPECGVFQLIHSADFGSHVDFFTVASIESSMSRQKVDSLIPLQMSAL